MCVQFFREIPKELINIAGFVEWFCCCGCYLLVKLLCYLCFAVLLFRLVKLVQQFSAQNRYKFLVNFFDEITISSDVLRIIDSQFFSQPTTCNSASGQISGG